MSADQIRIELARILATFPPFSKSELRIGELNGEVKKLQIVHIDGNDCDGAVGELTHLILSPEELRRYANLFQDPESKNSYADQLTFVKQHVVSWYLNIPPRQNKKAVVMRFVPTAKKTSPVEHPKEEVKEVEVPITPVVEDEEIPGDIASSSEEHVEVEKEEVKKPGRKKKDV